jgi:uncharacterized membrane protein
MGKTAVDFFTTEEKAKIQLTIAQAEKKTSGEIRVHIENICRGDVLDRAATLFDKLGMAKTELRNGVLIYIAIKSHKLAILGDMGINASVPENFWGSVKDVMVDHFKNNEFSEGLIKGIAMAGEQLKAFFPWEKDDSNELSDEISFGKN